MFCSDIASGITPNFLIARLYFTTKGKLPAFAIVPGQAQIGSIGTKNGGITGGQIPDGTFGE